MNKVVEPLDGTKSDGQIIVDIMNRMGYAQADYDPETLLEEIDKFTIDDFYFLMFCGVKYETNEWSSTPHDNYWCLSWLFENKSKRDENYDNNYKQLIDLYF